MAFFVFTFNFFAVVEQVKRIMPKAGRKSDLTAGKYWVGRRQTFSFCQRIISGRFGP